MFAAETVRFPRLCEWTKSWDSLERSRRALCIGRLITAAALETANRNWCPFGRSKSKQSFASAEQSIDTDTVFAQIANLCISENAVPIRFVN